MPIALIADAVSKHYGTLHALDHVTFTAQPGTVTGLLGANGAGKSTLVACCTGITTPTAGHVYLETSQGRVVAGSTAQARALVGVMLQSGGLPSHSKPMPLLRHLASFFQTPTCVDTLADRLGITDYANTTIRRMSGGQRQRVAFAAALVGRPQVLFLDEPTVGMDAAAADVVHDVIAETRDAGTAIVLTTHNMPEAASLSDHVAVLSHGQIVAQGTPHDMAASLGEEHTLLKSTPPLTPQAVAGALGSAADGSLLLDDGTLDIPRRLDAKEMHTLLGQVVSDGGSLDHVEFRSATLEQAVRRLTSMERAAS